MTILEDRLLRAADDASVAVGVTGLMATFNDAGVLSPGDVQAALAAARLVGADDELEVLAAALAVRGARHGHVAIRPADQRETIVVEGADPGAVDGLPWPDALRWEEAVATGRLAGAPDSRRPLVLEDGRLYTQKFHDYETRLAALIIARTGGSPSPQEGELDRHVDELLPPLADGTENLQNRAARIALGGRLTVVAGGPGTGKTYAVARMLQALARAAARPFPRIALCAPTGKAAARLGEEIASVAKAEPDAAAAARMQRIEASTIHRLLGSHPARARFRHDAHNPLPHDLVIVDEMSMVSLPLAAKLVSALRPEAAIVLVGDPDQLESIEAGTVLSDLVASGVEGRDVGSDSVMTGRVVVLDRVHRFDAGGAIARFAAAVRRGDADEAVALLAAGHDGLTWVRDEGEEALSRLTGEILERRARVVSLAMEPGSESDALDELSRLAVLCAHRRGRHGVESWQRTIEAGLMERFPDIPKEGEWYPGRPVMITRNDPNLQLFNGDIGVTALTGNGLRTVFRRDGIVEIPRSHLGEHASVHALTIHKSQGSQFREAVVSLPGEASRLLTRELLYTAVTRASDAVTIIGEEGVIRRAVERRVQRASGLEARLRGSAEARRAQQSGSQRRPSTREQGP